MNDRRLGSRIVIVGTSGSGKTTLAREIAAMLGIEHLKLDSLAHDANWQRVSHDEYLDRVRPRLKEARWVGEGALEIVPPDVWNRAETIIWLDYPRRVVTWRLVRRAMSLGLWRRGHENKGSLMTRLATRYYRPWADVRHGWRAYASSRATYEQQLTARGGRGQQFHRISTARERAELIEALNVSGRGRGATGTTPQR